LKLNPLESLTSPLTKRFGFVNQKDPEQVRREAQHQAEFEGKMEPSSQQPAGSSTKSGTLRRMHGAAWAASHGTRDGEGEGG
jgi:hypothetical protein